ncbi:MAG: polysaccharide deacetylase family protein [Patescibacteria group bacterium]|nr:polysaccharide deacetylase family protein [Patescibacteria group bacterium]
MRFLLLLRDLAAPFSRAPEVAVLCYHSVGDLPLPTAVTPDALRTQLAYLQKHGYTFLSLDSIVDWVEGREGVPRKAIALTFDDGYQDFEKTVLPILEEFKAPAALFAVGDGEKSRAALGTDVPLLDTAALARVASHPLVTLGYHSLTHPNLAKLDRALLGREVSSPWQAAYFAYPGGNFSDAATETVRAAGYRAAFTIQRHLVRPGTNPFLIPRSVVTHDMSPAIVRFHATRALEWYRTISRFL